MKFKRFAVFIGMSAILLVAGAAFGADKFDFDPMHTQIGFAVKHLVISTVRGQFREFTGTIQYDPTDLTKSSVSVTIKTASINTQVEMRDNDLRSPNFFDAPKYPEITFQSTRIEKKGDGFVAIGTLNMHGVSKEVALPFTMSSKIKDPWGKERFAVEGTLTIDRRDWGLTWDQRLDGGGLVVGNEIKIELSVEAVKG